MNSVELWNSRIKKFFTTRVSSGSNKNQILAYLINKIEKDIIRKNIPTHKGMSALDIGAGRGRWTKYLSRYLGQVIAIEPSKIYKTLFKELKKFRNVECYNTEFENYHDNRKFDLIIISGVTMYIMDKKKPGYAESPSDKKLSSVVTVYVKP